MMLNWHTLPLLLAAVPQSLFVLLYAVRPLGAGKWWRDSVGRALFIKAAALALVLDLFALWFFYPAPWVVPLMGVAYWLVFAAVTYQLLTLLRQRHEERDERPAAR